jgi:hypothetical protein
MNVTGTSTANYNGPSGYALQFNGSSGTLYGNGTNMQVTPSQASIGTPWANLTMNSSNGLLQYGGGPYVQVTGGNATMNVSGATVQCGGNAIALSSAGTIGINSPNGQGINMDPGRVGIQGMDFKQHTHGGIQTGGSYSQGPSGP